MTSEVSELFHWNKKNFHDIIINLQCIIGYYITLNSGRIKLIPINNFLFPSSRIIDSSLVDWYLKFSFYLHEISNSCNSSYITNFYLRIFLIHKIVHKIDIFYICNTYVHITYSSSFHHSSRDDYWKLAILIIVSCIQVFLLYRSINLAKDLARRKILTVKTWRTLAASSGNKKVRVCKFACVM